METLFSMLGLYQLSSLVLPGAVAVSGTYYAVAGFPPNPSTAAVIGLVVLFYVAGNVIQGAAVFWEARWWKWSGGWPSANRMMAGHADAYALAFRQLIQMKLDNVVGVNTASLPLNERFAIARAELRRLNQDGRSESFNSMYGLSRGLVSAGALIVTVAVICLCCGHADHRNWILALVVGASVVPVALRFRRFGFYFADQVWRDFAALA